MQCPPTPGPGVNFMNPNGLVAAASITSHTSTPSFSHTIAISLTRPMLTLRNVFSRILTSSAASVDETGTSVSMAGSYTRSEEHTSELQSQSNLVCRLLLEKKKKHTETA